MGGARQHVGDECSFHLLPILEPGQVTPAGLVPHVPGAVVAIGPLEIGINALDSGSEIAHHVPDAWLATAQATEQPVPSGQWIVMPGTLAMQARHPAQIIPLGIIPPGGPQRLSLLRTRGLQPRAHRHRLQV